MAGGHCSDQWRGRGIFLCCLCQSCNRVTYIVDSASKNIRGDGLPRYRLDLVVLVACTSPKRSPLRRIGTPYRRMAICSQAETEHAGVKVVLYPT